MITFTSNSSNLGPSSDQATQLALVACDAGLPALAVAGRVAEAPVARFTVDLLRSVR